MLMITVLHLISGNILYINVYQQWNAWTGAEIINVRIIYTDNAVEKPV